MSRILRTKDYSKFKYRSDNRRVMKRHVERLADSIAKENMLEMTPILVDEDFYVLDGQHRLQAAQKLGVEIFYTVTHKAPEDALVLLNQQSAWSLEDYMKFYCQKGVENYVLLQKDIEKLNIKLRVILVLLRCNSSKKFTDFKNGNFDYSSRSDLNKIALFTGTKNTIKSVIGNCNFINSARFWEACATVFSHPDFSEKRWIENLHRLAYRIQPKVSRIEYVKMMMDIYNWGARKRLDFNCTEGDYE